MEYIRKFTRLLGFKEAIVIIESVFVCASILFIIFDLTVKPLLINIFGNQVDFYSVPYDLLGLVYPVLLIHIISFILLGVATNTRKKFCFFNLYIKSSIFLINSLPFIFICNDIDDAVLVYHYMSILYFISLFLNLSVLYFSMGEKEENNINISSYIKSRLHMILNKVKKTRRIYYIYEYIIIIIMFLLFILYLFIKKQSVINVCVYVYLLLILLFIYIQPKYDYIEEQIIVSANNIDYRLLKEIPVYISQYEKCQTYFKVFNIDFNHLFPKNSSDRKVILKNYDRMKCKYEIKNNTSLLFCVPILNYNEIYRISVNLSYKKEERLFTRKFFFYLETKKFDKAIIPFVKNLIFSDYTISEEEKKAELYVDELDFRYTYSTNYFYSNSFEVITEMLKQNINDSRLFLKHDDNYGNGKTITDINLISSANKVPVIISPWEENYDHDILFLIFKKIKKTTSTKFHKWNKECNAFYFALLVSIETLVISNYKTLRSIFYEGAIEDFVYKFPSYQMFCNKIMLLVFFIPLTVLIAFKWGIPWIIVFKKDYSKVYQSFFINEIHRMIISNPEIFLLIEDIDRLSKGSSKNIFRTISAINSKFSDTYNFIGILSYAKANIKNKNTIKDVEEKVCYKDINITLDILSAKKEMVKNIFIHNNVANENVDYLLNKIDEYLRTVTFRDLNKLIDDNFVKLNHFQIYSFIYNLRMSAKIQK